MSINAKKGKNCFPEIPFRKKRQLQIVTALVRRVPNRSRHSMKQSSLPRGSQAMVAPLYHYPQLSGFESHNYPSRNVTRLWRLESYAMVVDL
ncbi:hypothetical protein QE152_g25715 [Popillia japonica]|uniref:Uncharacterized protein n=1 Tax=Popillia japonica TaxID=7064 RepID=A0AAW1K1T7_POPJA